jgi:hypothetical protein
MEFSSSFNNNNVLSNKIKDYFMNNINLFLFDGNKIFIITKNDIFYKINIWDEIIPKFILSNDNSILDEMIVKELCHKNIIDLCFSLGFESYYYFARNIEKKSIVGVVMISDNWVIVNVKR